MKRMLARCAVSVLAAVLFWTAPTAALAEPDRNPDAETPQNGIPLLVLRIDEQELHQTAKGNWYGSIADMNGSDDHSVRCEGSIEFLIPEGGYASEYGGTAPEGSIRLDYIRGRGNSTWTGYDKKPYKIQLKERADLFGMGESREWALLANAADPTLLKNRITNWLGSSLGLSYTPQMVPVDVVMIGSRSGRTELGSYYLSELVSVEPSRLAIDELEKDVISVEGETNITGGYLLSIYNLMQDQDEPESNVCTLSGGEKLIHEEPSFQNEAELTDGERAQRAYIRSYVRTIDELIMNSDTIDAETHRELDSLLDLRSAADYWLIQEFSRNNDAYHTSSTYLYKPRDGKLYFGPLWDFDRAWGDPQFPYNYEFTTAGLNNTRFSWIDALRAKDPYFVEILAQEWQQMEALLGEMVGDGGVMERYRDEVDASRQADYQLWAESEGGGTEEYDTLISNLKDWIALRQTWIDDNPDEFPQSFVLFTFMTPEGETVHTAPVRKGDYLYEDPEPPLRDGAVFIGWFERDSHEALEVCQADRDTAFVADYLDADLAVMPEALYLDRYEEWLEIGESYSAGTRTAILPENVSYGKIRWTSSNADVVVIREGTPYAIATGDAVVTGTLYNGVSASCTVHVYNARTTEKATAEGVRAAPETVRLAPGQTVQVLGILTPEDRLLDSMSIRVTSDDPTLAEVRACGALSQIYVATGMKEGRTTLTIEAEDIDTGRVYTAHCTVTVTGQTGFALPEGLTSIEDEAFRGTAPHEAVIPDQVTSIGSKAFADNDELLIVTVYPKSLTIAADAFENCPNLIVYGYADADAESYCSQKSIPFVPIA